MPNLILNFLWISLHRWSSFDVLIRIVLTYLSGPWTLNLINYKDIIMSFNIIIDITYFNLGKIIVIYTIIKCLLWIAQIPPHVKLHLGLHDQCFFQAIFLLCKQDSYKCILCLYVWMFHRKYTLLLLNFPWWSGSFICKVVIIL